jgi:hypothetical protein
MLIRKINHGWCMPMFSEISKQIGLWTIPTHAPGTCHTFMAVTTAASIGAGQTAAAGWAAPSVAHALATEAAARNALRETCGILMFAPDGF